MDNMKLARFITSLGRFNDYGSTVAQTKKQDQLFKGLAFVFRNDGEAQVFRSNRVPLRP